MIRLLAGVWLLLMAMAGQTQAHDLRPALLAITESAPDVYAVTWKAPALGERRLAIYPRLPRSVVETSQREGAFLSDAYLERWTVHAPDGFAGETITIDGLPESRTDVLVRIQRLDGESSTARLTPGEPSFEVPVSMGLGQVALTYLGLGVEHILFGVDHLLFVLALVILVRGWKQICLTVTAFTVAHSITLAAATLGYLNVPGPPVEAAIALSIVLVAVEIVNVGRGREGLAARAPWLIAFAFGLLHGLGFAGALSQVGLPGHAIPAALLFFNIGVEIGQLAFIAAIMLLYATWRRLWDGVTLSGAGWSHALPMVGAAYCIGGIASFWLIGRVYAFWA